MLENSPAATSNAIRVLVVDDIEDNRMLLAYVLKREGFAVTTADGGAQALELVAENDFDIVLMDIQMPELDGFQSLQLLRQRGFKNPIVALTAHAMDADRVKSMAAGFLAHLTKPIDKAVIVCTIRALVGHA